jgi:hypothetical protein
MHRENTVIFLLTEKLHKYTIKCVVSTLILNTFSILDVIIKTVSETSALCSILRRLVTLGEYI